jgi:DNA-binding PadR family transcriptional regulator
MKQSVSHAGFPDHEIAAEEADIRDLEEAGYLRFHPSNHGIIFDVSSAGRKRAEELEHAFTAVSGGVDTADHALEWSTHVLPILSAAARAYSRAPSPLGAHTGTIMEELAPDADEETVMRVLDELVRAGYLEETLGTDQLPGPAAVRLTEKGLQVTAGWPTASGEIALDRLLAVIEQRIDAAETDDERSRWERLRDGVTGVGRDVLVGVLTTTVNAAAKHVAG